MSLTLLVFAVVAAGTFMVESQIFPPIIDDAGNVKEREGALTKPGALPVPLDAESTSPKEGQVDGQNNETDGKGASGSRYFWSRDLGAGDNAAERAFAPNGSNVIVHKSKDRTLLSRNITRSTSVYNLTETGSLVAIIPWGFYGPCLIRNTSLTYPRAIDLLTARNGSKYQPTNRLLTIDANVAPLSSEQSTTFLAAHPFLRRWCRFRPIIITVDIGENAKPFSNSTEQIATLLLEADVNIILPEQFESPEKSQAGDGKTGLQRSIDQASRWGFTRNLLVGQEPVKP